MTIIHRLLILLPVLLLSAAAVAAANYEERAEVRAFIAELAARDGFDAEDLSRLFSQARSLPAVIKAILPPADPGIRSWQVYRNGFVETKRIAGGVRFWQTNDSIIAAASARYGVPEEIIVSIIGVETIYGRNMGRFETFSALTTLAFDYPPRAELFRRELEQLLLLAREQHRNPLDYRSSYAGAIGLPQFLPSSLRNYAVDFDGDGKIDLSGNAADAIGSVANFLHEHGWETGQPITAPVQADGGHCTVLLAAGLEPQLKPSEMGECVVNLGTAPELPAALVELVTPGQAPEYRLGYRNFYVLSRYNRSSFYAMAVNDLAEALIAARQSPTATLALTPARAHSKSSRARPSR
jgi:membrane-bound lytic murein transglycosylase B